MERNLDYINQGRGGYVVYKDDRSTIKLDFEFGGGDCVVIIYIPTVETWTEETKRDLADRQSILTFIAERSIKDQAPNCYYELTEGFIEIYENKKKIL